MNAEPIQNCPKCQTPIPPQAPQGLCPKCLLAAASIPTEAGHAPDAPPPPSIESVAAAFPQLEILEFVGQGGMGVVFKARQPKLDRFVALKLLPQKPGADPAFIERFNREGRMLARLSHPNIVAVHDFGQAGPFFYLLMEFVDGVNLRQAMRAGRFTPPQALALVPRICDALQYAHEEGVLHRDIKPENLLLDTRGRLKIADFGIAKLLGETKDITLTARGSTIGTPHYMAPEQLERPHDVDQRADVYSLGVVFYEMLTGELPLGRFAPPSEKTPMDPRVDEVVLRALEKERERRFQSAGDVRTQVEKITATPRAGEPGPGGTVNLGAGDAPPRQAAPGERTTMAAPTARLPWSARALVAATLVGLSVLETLLAVLAGRIGPSQVVLLAVVAGLPGLAGVWLAWAALREFKARPGERRGEKLAVCTALAWPLLLLDIPILFILVLFLQNVLELLFRSEHGFLVVAGASVGILGILTLDVWIVRRFLERWNSDRTLPTSVLQAHLARVPRRVLLISGLGFGLLFLVLLAGREHARRLEQPPSVDIPEPNAPTGYEISPGHSPEGDDHVYHSSVTIPPGYAITLTAVLLSNQIVLNPGASSASAVLLAPEGSPLHGHFTWRLLGNTRLADGAPLQLSLGLMSQPSAADRSFHLIPPEPVAIDWVGEPDRIWPPRNGHAKFLLAKGSAINNPTEIQTPNEWAVGVEARLDPIPDDMLRNLKEPLVGLGANWRSVLEMSLARPADATNGAPSAPVEAAAPIPPEKLAEYKMVCALLDELASQERQLLVQLTPENPVVKNLRELVAAKQKTRTQLEQDYPGLATMKPATAASRASEE